MTKSSKRDGGADEAARIVWPADLPPEPVYSPGELEAIGAAESLLASLRLGKAR